MADTRVMAWKFVWFYRRQRGRLRRYRRLLFASPAEIELIRLMKGSAIQIDLIKDRRTGFPLTFVTDMGWFKKHHMKREVRVGRYWTDFANDIGRCIEVDGRQWHMDVVKEQQRDDYIKGFGYLLLHLKAGDIYDNPDVVRRRVITFLLHGK